MMSLYINACVTPSGLNLHRLIFYNASTPSGLKARDFWRNKEAINGQYAVSRCSTY
jgi:hypothetical protein